MGMGVGGWGSTRDFLSSLASALARADNYYNIQTRKPFPDPSAFCTTHAKYYYFIKLLTNALSLKKKTQKKNMTGNNRSSII